MSRMGSSTLPDGGRLRYDEAGDGPAVTLLHPGLWDRADVGRPDDVVPRLRLPHDPLRPARLREVVEP